MTKPKKILFIVSRLPINLETGDRLRVYHFVKNLRKRGHQVDMLGFVPPGDYTMRTDIEQLCGHCIGVEKKGIEFKNPSRLGQLKAFMGSLFQGLPYRVWWWQHNAFIAKAHQLLNQHRYDVVHFSSPAVGIVFKEICKRRSTIEARFVYDLIDSFALKLKNSLSGKASLLWPFRAIDLSRLKRFEQQVVAQADQAILISERDKQFVGEKDIAVIPNGIEEASTNATVRDIDLVFVGNMATEPNLDAMRWFTQKIWPDLRAWNASLNFYITGASPPAEIQQLQNKHITVTGYVDDIHPYYRRAKIFVCPMRKGAGQKNKILEAMINKTPVISTAEGNMGIEAPPGAITIANTAEAFTAKIKMLLHDEEKRNQFAQNGYHYVRSNFSWQKSVDLLEQCYEPRRKNSNRCIGNN